MYSILALASTLYKHSPPPPPPPPPPITHIGAVNNNVSAVAERLVCSILALASIPQLILAHNNPPTIPKPAIE